MEASRWEFFDIARMLPYFLMRKEFTLQGVKFTNLFLAEKFELFINIASNIDRKNQIAKKNEEVFFF